MKVLPAWEHRTDSRVGPIQEGLPGWELRMPRSDSDVWAAFPHQCPRYGLATAIVNFVPGANVAKMAVDAAAASAALATTNVTMSILVKNSIERKLDWHSRVARRVHKCGEGHVRCGWGVRHLR